MLLSFSWTFFSILATFSLTGVLLEGDLFPGDFLAVFLAGDPPFSVSFLPSFHFVSVLESASSVKVFGLLLGLPSFFVFLVGLGKSFLY